MVHRNRVAAFTLVELLVVIAIIGVLVGLLLPGVQMVREAARRSSCQNNLKQLGLAVQMYHDSMGRIPPGRAGDGFLTWPVFIMPYVEQEALQNDLDLKAKYANQNPQLITTGIPVMFCPTRRDPGSVSDFEMKGEPRGSVGDYAGNAGTEKYFYNLGWADFVGDADGVFNSGLRSENPVLANRLTGGGVGRYRMSDVHDGLTTTIFLGEKAVSTYGELQPGGWGDGSIYNGEEPGTAMRLGGPGFAIARTIRIEGPGPGTIPVFGSYHPGVCNFVMGDGSVQSLEAMMSEETLRRLCSRDDGVYVELK